MTLNWDDRVSLSSPGIPLLRGVFFHASFSNLVRPASSNGRVFLAGRPHLDFDPGHRRGQHVLEYLLAAKDAVDRRAALARSGIAQSVCRRRAGGLWIDARGEDHEPRD